MCDFISWIEKDKDVFYLTKDDLKGRKFAEYKKYNPRWYDDIMGHGAIEFFWSELNGKGRHRECEDFSSPENFPPEIVESIKNGEFRGIGIALDILTPEARAEYKKIANPALEEYNKIIQNTFWDLAKQKENRVEIWR